MSNDQSTLRGLMGLGAEHPRPAAGGIKLPKAGGNALANLLVKPEIRDVWFNNKPVTLDGYRFVGCRFDNCILTVMTPNFELIDCHVDDSTRIQYGTQLVKVIQLFNFNKPDHWVYEKRPAFAPTKNPDGTITITA